MLWRTFLDVFHKFVYFIWKYEDTFSYDVKCNKCFTMEQQDGAIEKGS
jgi:hypothetical protein